VENNRAFVSRLPFLVVLVILALATICAAAVQLSDRVPLSPWESAVVMEAVRLNAGLPVYETAHATHMYGPLLTVLLGGVFQVFGFNVLATRIVMSGFAFALAILLSAIFCSAKSRPCWAWPFFFFLELISAPTSSSFPHRPMASPRFWPSLLSTFGPLEKAHCSFLLLPSHFFLVPRCASKPVPPSRLFRSFTP